MLQSRGRDTIADSDGTPRVVGSERLTRFEALRAIVDGAVERPRSTLGFIGLVTVAALAVVPRLTIDAGHSGLVDHDVHYQRAYSAFQAEFGSPDQLVVVIEGGDEAMRRALVDRLADILPGPEGVRCDAAGADRAPGCVRDVFGRLDLEREGLTSRALLYLPVAQLETVVSGLAGEALGLQGARELRGLRHLFATMAVEIERRAEEEMPAGDAAADRARWTMSLAVRFLDEATARVRDDARSQRDLEEAILGELEMPSAGQALDRKGYASSPDGKIKLALVRPMVDTDDPVHVMPFVRYVRERSRAAATEIGAACAASVSRCPDGPLRASMTGLPALITDEAESILSDTSSTGVIAAFGVLFVLLAGFRSWTRTLLSVVPLVVTLIWTVAFTQVVFGSFNMITASCVPVLLGLCIDSAVHLITRFDESRVHGRPSGGAMADAVVGAGPGLVTGALTTSGAFFALAVSEFKGFQQLGAITGFGLIVGLGLTLTLIPALSALPGVQRALVRDRADRRAFGGRLMARVPGLVVRRAGAFVVTGSAVAVLMLVLAQDIRWSYDYGDLLPTGTESTETAARLVASTEYSSEVAAVGADSIEEAERLATAFEALGSVGRVESLSRFIPSRQDEKLKILGRLGPMLARAVVDASPEPVDVAAIRDAAVALGDAIEDARYEATQAQRDEAELLAEPLRATRALARALGEVPSEQAAVRLRRLQVSLLTARDRAVKVLASHVGVAPITADVLLANLPRPVRDRFASGTRFAVYAYPAESVFEGENLERFVSDLRSVASASTGFPVIHLEMNDAVKLGFRDASVLAVIVLFLLLLGDFRRLSYALLAMVPLAVAIAWGWGAISVLGIEYNVGNIVALPLVLGIAVDSGVHILHRFQQERGEDVAAVVRHTGRAVMLSGLTTMAGFAALLLASHKAMATFGLFLLLGIGAGLVSAVCFLPAVLELVRRRLPVR